MPYLKTLLLLSITVMLFSCEKVIDVDLNSSSPQYVIEGNVSNESGPYTVSITRSKNFDETNQFPPATGGLVTITDETAAYTDTLIEVEPGQYRSQNLVGIAGHTYRLRILIEGNEFTSTSSMPQLVTLDSILISKSLFDEDYDVIPVYNDPAGRGNYYQIIERVNSSSRVLVFVRDDELTDGETVDEVLRNGFGEAQRQINPGDTAYIDLRTVDRGVFTYYNSLQLVTDDNTATPANPISNISGGALGYFNAYSTSKRTFIFYP
ncbi:MAG: DUF4249 family protein [Chitinophagales bacterium]|nr:DUF4249 family protein [Chitinophagales bacterium]